MGKRRLLTSSYWRSILTARRLVLLEELKSLPWAAVWDYYCASKGVPVGACWFEDVRRYEREVLAQR